MCTNHKNHPITINNNLALITSSIYFFSSCLLVHICRTPQTSIVLQLSPLARFNSDRPKTPKHTPCLIHLCSWFRVKAVLEFRTPVWLHITKEPHWDGKHTSSVGQNTMCIGTWLVPDTPLKLWYTFCGYVLFIFVVRWKELRCHQHGITSKPTRGR